eukprot:3960972-Pyramimonas_sp.AAC.1
MRRPRRRRRTWRRSKGRRADAIPARPCPSAIGTQIRFSATRALIQIARGRARENRSAPRRICSRGE